MYTYTLNDLYVIFRQTPGPDKIRVLQEFKDMNLEYDINWDGLINYWTWFFSDDRKLGTRPPTAMGVMEGSYTDLLLKAG